MVSEITTIHSIFIIMSEPKNHLDLIFQRVVLVADCLFMLKNTPKNINVKGLNLTWQCTTHDTLGNSKEMLMFAIVLSVYYLIY